MEVTNKSKAKIILIASPIVCVAVMILSILFGAKQIPFETIVDALLHFDADNSDHQIVVHSRVPRAVGTLLIGAFLAISGSLMQGMTRNYLASPSIMGVTDGSAFFITLCMVFFPNSTSLQLVFCSLIGSAVGVSIVFGLGSLLPKGLTPVRLAIIGTIIGTFLSSAAAAFAIYYKTSQDISFWYNARLHQLDLTFIKLTIPFAIIGLILAIYLARSITILSLGDQVAVGLGEKTTRVKILTIASVAILTGVSVALAGKIAFVGLLIPHITRFLVGSDYRFIIPASGVIGAVFLVLADVGSRFLNMPFETPISVLTSLIGIPFFIYLIKSNGGKAYV